jgi:hypothetical protein
MLEDVRREVESTVAPLIRGILEDSQKLFRQELALVKVEVREDARRARDAVIAISAGVVVCLVGLFLFGCMLAYLIDTLSEAIPLWGSFGIVAAIAFLVGGAFLLGGVKRAKGIKGIPKQTVETMRENVQWIQHKA